MSQVTAWDAVSGSAEIRVRRGDAPFGEWRNGEPGETVDVSGVASIVVEARDNEDNVDTKTYRLTSESAVEDSADGGGCTAAPRGPSGGPWWWVLAVALGGVAAWRRRAAAARAALALTAITTVGCGASDGSERETGGGGEGTDPPIGVALETVEAGIIGSYTSAAVDTAGELWVAGVQRTTGSFGIPKRTRRMHSSAILLLAGTRPTRSSGRSSTACPASMSTLPPGSAGGPPDPSFTDVESFRGGLVEPGDDVGLFTAMVSTPSGPVVAYYDATHQSVKIARRAANAWLTYELESAPEVRPRAPRGRRDRRV